jgi:hypothetical protein
MAFPYSSGDVLTAADLNASSGLVLVKTQTVGSAVSSVTINNAFSSTFENYRIHITDITSTADRPIQMQLGSETTSVYSYVGFYQRWSSSTVVAYGPTTATVWDSVGRVTTNGSNHCEINLFAPYESKNTHGFSNGGGIGSSEYLVNLNLWLDTSDSYTSFTFFPTSGTMTGGTIRVYGYNNG